MNLPPFVIALRFKGFAVAVRIEPQQEPAAPAPIAPRLPRKPKPRKRKQS